MSPKLSMRAATGGRAVNLLHPRAPTSAWSGSTSPPPSTASLLGVPSAWSYPPRHTPPAGRRGWRDLLEHTAASAQTPSATADSGSAGSARRPAAPARRARGYRRCHAPAAHDGAQGRTVCRGLLSPVKGDDRHCRDLQEDHHRHGDLAQNRGRAPRTSSTTSRRPAPSSGSLVTNLRAHLAMTPPSDYRERLERHLEETRTMRARSGAGWKR